MQSRADIGGRLVRRGSAEAEPRRGLVLLARAGLVARGVLYVLVGMLAFDVAQGETGKNASQQGAVQVVAAEPFGKVLLVLMAIGVAGYALWRAVQAAMGREIESGHKRDTSERVGAASAAVAYVGILATIMSILLGSSSGNGNGGLDRITTWAMDISPWLVGAAGAIVIAVALYQALKGVRRKFMDNLRTGRMTEAVCRWVRRVGLVGYVARAIVFGLIGVGMLQAARSYDPQKAQGLDGSLQELLQQTYGGVLVGVVAVGLIAFGLFSFVESRYRRV